MRMLMLIRASLSLVVAGVIVAFAFVGVIVAGLFFSVGGNVKGRRWDGSVGEEVVSNYEGITV